MGLLPQANILETYRLAAEVFVGAAFGENILYLFRLPGQTVLVTEYEIDTRDTLCNLMLADVAYGYSVVPILHQNTRREATFLPSDDVILRNGDRLVVLASMASLKRIEVRDLNVKTWRIQIDKIGLQTSDFKEAGADILILISGCSPGEAHQAMADPPQILSKPLYRPQAQRLQRALKRMQITSSLIPLGE